MSQDKKIYKSIILEVRPRLQSVNVLVNLFEKTENVKIVLGDNNFQILVGEVIYNINCKNLKIVSDSLSSLTVTESYISFRFATANNLDDWGSFKTELLETSSCISNGSSQSIFLDKSLPYKIECKNCSQTLTQSVKFERVLPLPSENAEPNEWFCHDHGDKKVSLLDPKESDVFYASCYCHLSKKIVQNILESDKLLICKRCLNWLGQVKNSEVVKFWFNTVIFKDTVNTHTSSAMQDVFKTLQEILNNILFNTAKIMLYCQSSKKQTDYILLWILEKQLRVQISDVDEEMQDYKVAKVLFKYENRCSDVVKKWLDDANVLSVEISKPMTVELLKHLYKYNKIIPKVFSESNNFYISYLMMYEHNK